MRSPLFEPDIERANWSPEQNLIGAVLFTALVDAVNGPRREKRLAQRWILQSLPNQEFSFLWCCSELGVLAFVKEFRQIVWNPNHPKRRRLFGNRGKLNPFMVYGKINRK